MSTTVEDEKLSSTEFAGMTPLTSSSAIPPRKTRSEGNFVQICKTNTSTTTKTTNHAAKLNPNSILLIYIFITICIFDDY